MNATVKIDDYDFTPAYLTCADVLTMTGAGVLPEGRGYELIEGVLVKMAAQHSPHVRMIHMLMRKLITLLPENYAVSPGPSIILSDDTMLEPDICVYPASMESLDVRGADILLAIEVSDTTLRNDLGKKARLYAEHGVRDYWVFDVTANHLHRHSEPSADGYASIEVSGFDQPVPLPIDGLGELHSI